MQNAQSLVYEIGDVVALTKEITFYLLGLPDEITTFDVGMTAQIEAYEEDQENPFRLTIIDSDWKANVTAEDIRLATKEEYIHEVCANCGRVGNLCKYDDGCGLLCDDCCTGHPEAYLPMDR